MNFKKLKNNKKGFTLIEFLLYISIISVVLLIAGGIALNILLAKAKLGAIDEVNQNTRVIVEKVLSSIRNAEVVNSPLQGATSSSLSLQMANSYQNPTVFDLSGSSVRVSEGGGPAVNLNSDSVFVSDLFFTNTSYTDTPGTITFQITSKYYNPNSQNEYNFEKTFYATANIRKNQ
ncbi:prepilin-type N-terminal cleavage/methylation domain-containing protein [Patescibacteria group bacterium]